MANYKYKLPEKKVGDVDIERGVKSTIRSIDPETGTISWDIEYVPAFDTLFDSVTDLTKTAKGVYIKTKKDAKFREFYEEANKLRNAIRTHLRNEYPDEYKNMKNVDEMSITQSGGSGFTPGTGETYATPYAFTKKGKKQNDATKYILKKFGYKLAPSIPNRPSKVIDYKKIMEGDNMYKYKLTEAENDVEVFQQQRIQDFDELEKRLDTLRKKLRQGKLSTQRYYRENPKSYSVVYGTDMINDYFNDIEELLTQDQ